VTLTEKLNLYEFMMAILPVHYTFFVLTIIAVGCGYNNLTNLLLVESYYFSGQNNILHKRERYLPVFCYVPFILMPNSLRRRLLFVDAKHINKRSGKSGSLVK